MRKYFYFLLIVILSFPGCSFFVTRMLKPYDPQKAGATIEEQYDISQSLGLKKLDNNTGISTRFALAEYDNEIYISLGEKIHVFDKTTFTKTREMQVKYPDSNTKREVYYLTIANDGVAFLLSTPGYWDQRNFWLLDLSTGNAILVNNDFFPDFDHKEIINFKSIAHNRNDNTLWFYTSYRDNFYVFLYNTIAGTFIFQECKPRHNPLFRVDGMSIYDNIIWYCGHVNPHHDIWDYIEIDKYIVGENESVHTINVEYLNTLTLPQSALYDPPYIWFMADKDNKVQILKLLPYE